MDVVIRCGHDSDLEAITAIQHRAFYRVAQQLGINPCVLPPLKETASDMRALLESGTEFFVAQSVDGTLVGSVRANRAGERIEIGRLVVEDGWEGMGVATRLMDALEAAYADAAAFELFTGVNATRALGLYLRRGYVEFKRDTSGPVDIVWLERIPARSLGML